MYVVSVFRDDFSDLEEKLQWAMDHDDQAKQIAMNGKRYASQFLDQEMEHRLSRDIIDAYHIL